MWQFEKIIKIFTFKLLLFILLDIYYFNYLTARLTFDFLFNFGMFVFSWSCILYDKADVTLCVYCMTKESCTAMYVPVSTAPGYDQKDNTYSYVSGTYLLPTCMYVLGTINVMTRNSGTFD